jgi:hypothetical protein
MKLKTHYNGFLVRYNRAGVHIGLFMDLFNMIKDFLILIAVYKLSLGFGVTISIVLCILYVVIRQIVGYIDIHSKFYEEQNTLNNKYNKQISDIDRKVTVLYNGRKRQKRI